MTTLDPSSRSVADLQGRLRDRLALMARRMRTHAAVEGIAHTLIFLTAFVMAGYLIDRSLRLSVPLRVAWLAVGACAIAVAAYRWVVQPLFIRLGPVDLSATLERVAAGSSHRLAQRVATVLELPTLLDAESPPSRVMVETAVRVSATAVDGVAIENHLDQRRLRIHLAILAFVLVSPFLIAWIAPVESGIWARRWLRGSNEPYPQRTYLRIEGLTDGKITVSRGEPCVLRVTLRPGTVDPGDVALRLRDGRGHTERIAMTRFAPGDFRYDIPAVQEAMTFSVHGNDDDEGPFEVVPVDRPRLVEVVLSSQHPTEKQPQRYTFSGHDADLSFFPKTKMELTLVANVPISKIRLAGDRAPAAELRRVDDTRFTAAWTHERPTSMQVELVARDGGLASLPTPISIGLKVDRPPRVTMKITGVKQRVSPAAEIPIMIEARDDIGLADLGISIDVRPPESTDLTAAAPPPTTAPSSQRVLLRGPATPATELEWLQKHTLDLAAMKLSPGAVVRLTADAHDDAYGGGQVGRSRPMPLRVVTAEELFREILMRLQQERTRFRKATEEAQAIGRALQTAATPAAVATLSPRFQAVEHEAARVGAAFADALEEMKLNSLGSPEAYGLMDHNILTPLNQLRDGPMTDQGNEIKHLGQTPDASRQTAAVAREDRIADQMAAILKQMSQWDSFIDVLNQLNEVIRLEQNVKERTDKLHQDQINHLFEPEKH